MIFAMRTRASYSARLVWFQSLDRCRVSRMLRGLRPTPPGGERPRDAAPGFEKIARPGAFDLQYSHLLAHPGDTSREWGVDSFAQLPAPGSKVCKEIAQRREYRAPEVSLFGKGTNSGLWLVATDPDAALTVPSAGVVRQPVGTGVQ